MDGLTFTANVIKSIAWPATVLLLVILCWIKREALLPIVDSIKYKDLEIKLRKEFLALKEISTDIPLPAPQSQKLAESSLNEVEKIYRLDPSLAIFKVWQKLEAKIVQLIQHNGLVRFTNPQKFIAQLLRLGKITSQDAELFKKLQDIRNTVVHLKPYNHEVKITLAEVVEFKEYVDIFTARLESIRQEDGYINIEE